MVYMLVIQQFLAKDHGRSNDLLFLLREVYMKRLKKWKCMFICTLTILISRINSVSAAVKFNEAQASKDVKNLLDPVSSFMIVSAIALTVCSIGYSYYTWLGLETDEKENMPFHKTIKKHVIAFVLFGMGGVILKWFSIS